MHLTSVPPHFIGVLKGGGLGGEIGEWGLKSENCMLRIEDWLLAFGSVAPSGMSPLRGLWDGGGGPCSQG